MTNINTSIAVVIAAALFAVTFESAHAAGWELRTTEQAVPGTREIENGKISKAIEISNIRLPHVSAKQKVAVLNNLCIAYILSKEFTQAEEYCNQAVEQPNEQAVSFNNRGVLKAMQGDVEGAMNDFAAAANAGCMGECADSSSAPRDLPRPLARRNFDKAEYLVKQASDNSDESVAARIN